MLINNIFCFNLCYTVPLIHFCWSQLLLSISLLYSRLTTSSENIDVAVLFWGGVQKANDPPLNANVLIQYHWSEVRIHNQYNNNYLSSSEWRNSWFDSEAAEEFLSSGAKPPKLHKSHFMPWGRGQVKWSALQLKANWYTPNPKYKEYIYFLYIACFVVEANPQLKGILLPQCQQGYTLCNIYDKQY